MLPPVCQGRLRKDQLPSCKPSHLILCGLALSAPTLPALGSPFYPSFSGMRPLRLSLGLAANHSLWPLTNTNQTVRLDIACPGLLPTRTL